MGGADEEVGWDRGTAGLALFSSAHTTHRSQAFHLRGLMYRITNRDNVTNDGVGRVVVVAEERAVPRQVPDERGDGVHRAGRDEHVGEEEVEAHDRRTRGADLPDAADGLDRRRWVGLFKQQVAEEHHEGLQVAVPRAPGRVEGPDRRFDRLERRARGLVEERVREPFAVDIEGLLRLVVEHCRLQERRAPTRQRRVGVLLDAGGLRSRSGPG